MNQTFTTRPELRGTFGAVTSTHWIGSAVGMGLLERGGNAFDAAVATGFTLQIVEPHLNGPGGEVPIILQAAGSDAPVVICGQGTAPKAATISAYRDCGLTMVPGTGLLAAVVPGAFDAWMLMLRDYGSMRLRDVLEPAISYAINGFPIVYRAARAIHAIADHFKAEWPSSAAVWLPGGHAPNSNQLVTTPAIGHTFQRILDQAESFGSDRVSQIEEARKCFYEGFVAEAVDRFCRKEFADGSGSRNSGLLTGDDMASWNATYETTVSREYHGYQVHKTGPWGQGPVLLQALALLDGIDLASMDPHGGDFVHTIIETIKLAWIDRDVFYGDPEFVDIPLETLLSEAHNESRRKLITETASNEFRPSLIDEVRYRLETLTRLSDNNIAAGIGGGEPTFADIPEVEGDTVHLDVVDRSGNMVTATPSGGWLQSSPVIAELGFNLSTRAQMFWLDENLPSSLAPGRRPRTTLTPTLVTREGAPYIALGSPGGDQQDQWSLILLLRLIHHTKNLQAAIDAPMFHSKHVIASFNPRQYEQAVMLLEGRFDKSVQKELCKRGHQLRVEGDWSLGRLCAISRGQNGVIRAGATPRFMQGYAIGR